MGQRQTKSGKSPSTHITQHAPPSNTSPPTSPPTFRLRDLPEELQLQITNYLLPPTWSIRASRPIRSTRHSPSSTNPLFYGLRQTPRTPASLSLVDKHMAHQIQLCVAKNFSGHLYLASVVGPAHGHEEGALTMYYQYGLGEVPRPGGVLDGFRERIRVVHVGCYQYLADCKGFDVSLLGVLKGLKLLVAHSNNRINEASLYGWGDAESLIQMISEEALVRFVQRPRNGPGPGGVISLSQGSGSEGKEEGILEQLWGRGITTIHEMRASMGSGEMEIKFYVVFWIREGEDAVVLGRYSEKKWVGDGVESEALRRKVYEMALERASRKDEEKETSV